MGHAVFEVQVVGREGEPDRWLRVEAADKEDAQRRLTSRGEIVGDARVVEILDGDIGSVRGRAVCDTSAASTCLLLSAIFNILAGAFWTVLIITAVIGIPLIILAIFELTTRSRLVRSDAPWELKGRVQTLGVLEIIAGLFNGVALVCGILNLVLLSRLSPAGGCRRCGYPMSGTQSNQCPECGAVQ